MLDKEAAKVIVSALEIRERILAEKPTPLTEPVLVQIQRALPTMRAIAAGDTIASLWSVEDVYSLQDDEDEFTEAERITEDEARRVLELADNNHDATIGINWDVLQAHLDYIREGN